MNNRYNILWIDDQFDEMSGFIDDASLEGFDLKPFKSSREGMTYLREHLNEIDGVILDAKVFKEDANEVASEKGLMASLREIATLSGQHQGKCIPHVVFTGQPDLESDASFAERMDGIPVFSKNQPNEPLFEKLRKMIGDSSAASVRNRFRKTYEACGDRSIDPGCWKLLAPILDSVCGGQTLPTEPYNDVRKALEWIFRYLHRHCVIHERLVDGEGRVNLQGTSLFLAGKPTRFNSTGDSVSARQAILPRLLSDSLKFVLDVTQPGSHTETPEDAETGKPSIAAVQELAPDHHLLQVAALMTADLVQWAAAYVAANQDPEKNRALWDLPLPDSSEPGLGLDCRVINEAKTAFFAQPENPAETMGENIRIPKNLITTSRLSIGTHLRVTAQKVDSQANHWVASTVQVLS